MSIRLSEHDKHGLKTHYGKELPAARRIFVTKERSLLQRIWKIKR